jgi:hypothetical protein
MKTSLRVSVALLAIGLTFSAARAQRAQSNDTRAAQASLVKEVVPLEARPECA